jgi:hypothetical protein
MAENNDDQPKKRRGPGKPFQKGQSGNPGGRPEALREVVDLARRSTPMALQRLEYWARSDHPSASPKACEVLLDRGWGKATQPTEITGKDGGPIQTQAVEDARPALTEFLAEFGGKATEETRH